MMVGLGRTIGAPSERKQYDLHNRLTTFNQTLGRVLEAYVDPTRVDPKQMLLSALDSIQKQVAEVMIEPFPSKIASWCTSIPRCVSLASKTSIRRGRWRRRCRRFTTLSSSIFCRGRTTKRSATSSTQRRTACCRRSIRTRFLLDPQTYQEMKVSTSGRFGGLGIVIRIVNGALTVVADERHTGLGCRRPQNDRIVKIDKEWTPTWR